MEYMKFEGIMPALVTPLNEDESLNVTELHKLIDYLVGKGADGFYIGGATGEGILLPREVREELATEAVNAIKGRGSSIVHIASINFKEAIELAKQAERAGADAISAIPPIYFAYDEDDIFNYYKKLASVVSIPLMAYNTMAAGFSVSAEFAARLFTIDNVTSIKWTNPNYFNMMRIKELTHGEMNVINGPDEMLLCGLSMGADGGIGSTYNVMCERFVKLYKAFKNNKLEEAKNEQNEINEIINVLIKHKVIPATKATLKMMGLNAGEAVFPMKHYTNEEFLELRRELEAVGMKF